MQPYQETYQQLYCGVGNPGGNPDNKLRGKAETEKLRLRLVISARPCHFGYSDKHAAPTADPFLPLNHKKKSREEGVSARGCTTKSLRMNRGRFGKTSILHVGCHTNGEDWMRVSRVLRIAGAEELLSCAIQYRDGRGVKRNLRRAKVLFERAARAGSGEAKSALGQLLLAHPRNKRDRRMGIRWLRAAAASGIWSAPHFLGRAAEDQGDWSAARKWYERALKLGDLSSGIRLAKHYLDRLDARFHPIGVAFLRKAIRRSSIEPAWAYTELATCYLEGRGVPRSRQLGLKYLQIAAQKDARAHALLKSLRQREAKARVQGVTAQH
jgi:TPR repeat protein